MEKLPLQKFKIQQEEFKRILIEMNCKGEDKTLYNSVFKKL